MLGPVPRVYKMDPEMTDIVQSFTRWHFSRMLESPWDLYPEYANISLFGCFTAGFLFNITLNQVEFFYKGICKCYKVSAMLHNFLCRVSTRNV